jgi:hypothetical protein
MEAGYLGCAERSSERADMSYLIFLTDRKDKEKDCEGNETHNIDFSP